MEKTTFRAVCTTFQALVATTTTFDSATCALVAISNARSPPITAEMPVFNCTIAIIANPVLAMSST